LVEEGVLENKRRPKTINLHHRQGGQTRSRQAPIPQGRTLDEKTLFDLATNLFSQIILEGKVWPCANLSLSVGGFEDGVTGNMGIGAFLVKGEEAQALRNASPMSSVVVGEQRREEKRRRLDNRGIQRFFTKAPDAGEAMRSDYCEDATDDQNGGEVSSKHRGTASDLTKGATISSHSTSPSRQHLADVTQRPITDYICSRCNTGFGSEKDLQSHQDWHFAEDLQGEEERGASRLAAGTAPAAPSASRSCSDKPPGAGAGASSRKAMSSRSRKMEPGQQRLHFG